MSGRHGYSDDIDDPLQLGRWRGSVKSAIRGRRGQAMLRQLREALDAMPEKILFTGTLVAPDNGICTLGALCLHSKTMTREEMLAFVNDDGEDDEPEHTNALLSERLNVAQCLIQEIEYENDEGGWKETPEQRWQRMRRWVDKNIKHGATGAD